MDHTQAQILMAAAACLMVALFLSIARNASRYGTRDTISVAIDSDVDHAREGVRQLTADVERLHTHVRAARRDLVGLKADRGMVELKVKTASEPKRGNQTPPFRPNQPQAAKKKAPPKR